MSIADKYFKEEVEDILTKGFNLPDSIQRAKNYISGALSAMLDLGQGSGPMDHGFDLNSITLKD